jgi:hypothetical protein
MGRRSIGVDLKAMTVRIGKVNGLAYGVIGHPGRLMTRREVHQELPKRRPRGEEESDMKEAKPLARNHWRCPEEFVQYEECTWRRGCRMHRVTPRRAKSRNGKVRNAKVRNAKMRNACRPRDDLQTDHVAIVGNGPRQIGDLKMDGTEPSLVR